MTSRQVGRRMSTVAEEYRRGNPRRRTHRSSEQDEPLRPQEQRRLLQFVICGGIFAALVAGKILLPGQMEPICAAVSGVLHRNVDVQAVFSAVGRAVSGQEDSAWGDVYQAVFGQQEQEVLETAAESRISVEQPSALQTLRTETALPESTVEAEPLSETAQTDAADASETSYLFYSDRNLPDHVQMEQAVLGFAYCTPVSGVLSSDFGYREHPTEGEERFHYGIDLAADTGTAIGCFADGTVTAVGESSSYGKYVTVSHPGDYTTLYAHCSRITVSSGASVREGEKIAEVGETGMATGPHLHFELHHGSDYLNPIYYVTPA